MFQTHPHPKAHFSGLSFQKIKIRVQGISKEIYELSVCEHWSIGELKTKIEERVGYYPQSLLFNSMVLLPDKKISDYKIGQGATIIIDEPV